MRRLVLAVFVLVCAADAQAQVSCAFSLAPGNLSFGSWSVFAPGAPRTGNSTFNITCNQNNMIVAVYLSRSATNGSFDPRQLNLAAPAATLNYNLYTDSATTQIWGDGSGNTNYRFFFLPVRNTPLAIPPTIYGSLANAAADVPAGTYTDTITASLVYWNGSTFVTSNSTFTVSTIVQAECIVSSFNIDFGAYDPLGANAASPRDSSGVVNVYCTRATVGSVSLDNGSFFSGGWRRLAGPAGSFLNYHIYRDAARASIWDASNVNAATSLSRLVPLGGGFTAFGRIPANQDPAAGNYTDTVQATVTY